MRIYLILCIFFLFMDASQKKKIKVVVTKDWAPYYFTNAKGKPSGYAIDLFEAIAKKADISYEYIIVDNFKQSIKAIKDKKGDLVPNMGISHKRKELFYFTQPTDTFNISMYKRSTSTEIITNDHLIDKKVGVVSTNVCSNIIKKYNYENIVYFDDYPKAIKDLNSGVIDGFCYPEPLIEKVIQNLGFENKIVALKYPLKEIKRGMGISKDNFYLLSILNDGITQLKLSGEYSEIYLKWFPSQKKIELTAEQLIFVIISALGLSFTLILVLVFFSKKKKWILTKQTLENEIMKKTSDLTNYSNHLNNIINSIDAHIAIVDKNGFIVRTNASWQNFAMNNGYKKDPTMHGMEYLQQCNLFQFERCSNKCEEGIIKVLKGETEEFLGVYPCHAPTGKRWFNLRAKNFSSNDEFYTIISHENITNIKLIQNQLERINSFYSLLSKSNMALIESKTEIELLENVTNIIHLESIYTSVCITYKLEEKIKIMAKAGTCECSLFDNDLENKNPIKIAILENSSIVINDIENNVVYKSWLESVLQKRGLKSCAFFPIFSNEDFIGSINVFSNKKDSFADEEVQLMKKLAENLGFGIISLRDKIRIKEISIIDQLTNVYNRRRIDEVIEDEILKFKRYKNDTCFMLLDIDHFKSINDTYGHKVGDSVLKEFTKNIKETIRDIDILGRWGGEEFLVILPHTDIKGASVIAQRVRSNIEKYSFDTVSNITVSIGVTSVLQSDTIDTIIERVDKALYKAKDSGRNRVIVD